MSEDYAWRPPPTAKPQGGFTVAFRAGAVEAPRVWIDMGGGLPKEMQSQEPEREVFYMRDLYPNVR